MILLSESLVEFSSYRIKYNKNNNVEFCYPIIFFSPTAVRKMRILVVLVNYVRTEMYF